MSLEIERSETRGCRMTRVERLRARIDDVHARIATQETILAGLRNAGHLRELAADLLGQLIRSHNTYREILSWSERSDR